MPVTLGSLFFVGAVLLVSLLLLFAWTRLVARWRRSMDVSDDADYVATLTALSEASVRRHFNPYADID